MSVTVLDSQQVFRLTLASPAEVDTNTGEVILTTANLVSAAGEFTSIAASGNLTVGGTATVTGATTLNGALSVPNSTTALRVLTVSQTATITGALTANGGATVAGDLAVTGETSVADFVAGTANIIVVTNASNRLSFTLPTYADQTAAEAGGLVPPNAYVTPAGVVMLVMA